MIQNACFPSSGINFPPFSVNNTIDFVSQVLSSLSLVILNGMRVDNGKNARKINLKRKSDVPICNIFEK